MYSPCDGRLWMFGDVYFLIRAGWLGGGDDLLMNASMRYGGIVGSSSEPVR